MLQTRLLFFGTFLKIDFQIDFQIVIILIILDRCMIFLYFCLLCITTTTFFDYFYIFLCLYRCCIHTFFLSYMFMFYVFDGMSDTSIGAILLFLADPDEDEDVEEVVEVVDVAEEGACSNSSEVEAVI